MAFKDALSTGLANIIEALTSKKMIGLALTVGALLVSKNNPELAPFILGAGGAHQASQGASDAFGKGKVQAEKGKK